MVKSSAQGQGNGDSNNAKKVYNPAKPTKPRNKTPTTPLLVQRNIVSACIVGDLCFIKRYANWHRGKIPYAHQALILESTVKHGHTGVLQILFAKYGFDPNIRNSAGILIMSLCIFDISIDEQDNDNVKPSIVPRKRELSPVQLELYTIFVSNGANPNASVWPNGPTMLWLELYLVNGSSGDDIVQRYDEDIHYSNEYIVFQLLQKGSFINVIFGRFSVLSLAALANVKAVFKYYLEKGGNPNEIVDGKTARQHSEESSAFSTIFGQLTLSR